MTNPAIKQPTVRINQSAKQKLDKLQKQTDLSQPALLDRAIDLLEREMLAKQLESDFSDIASDPKKLAAYRADTDVFDGAVSDGLGSE